MQKQILFLVIISVLMGAGCSSTTTASRKQDAATAQLISDYKTQVQARVNQFNQDHQQALSAQVDQLNLLSVEEFNQQLRTSARQLAEKIVSDSGNGAILPGSFAQACYTTLQSDYTALDAIVTNLDSIRATYNSSTEALKVNLAKLDTAKAALQSLAISPSDEQEISAFISLLSKAYDDAQKQKQNATTGKSSGKH